MFYRNLAPVIPMMLMSNTFNRRPQHQQYSDYGSGKFNSNYEEEGPFENDGMFGGGVVGPLLVGGLTGVALASFLGNKQAYAATPYPVQAGYPAQSAYPMANSYPTATPYPVQAAYPVPAYQGPNPYYQHMQMPAQQISPQAQVVNQTAVSQAQGGNPKMPSVQSMPNDIVVQKQGQAYVTNPPMPSNQVTNSMPYYMFPIRKELSSEMRGTMPLQSNVMYRVIPSQQVITMIPSYTYISY